MEHVRHSILLADPQPLTAAGLVSMLSTRDELSITGQVNFRDELIPEIRKNTPQLLIADHNIPGFLSVEDLGETRRAFPTLSVLIISSDENRSSIGDVLQLGVNGYITKFSTHHEVMQAVHATVRGEKFYCQKALDVITEKHFSMDPPGEVVALTPREKEIITLIARGRSSQQIADELYLSPHTIHTHRKSIIRKLNIKSPTEFVIHAMDLGLIKSKF